MAASEDSPLVLVTGGSGYIAAHIIQQLQEDGQKVRTTVRSTEDEEKLKPIKELAPEASHELEIVEGDLTKPDTWESAIKDCSYVIHVASQAVACGPQPANSNEEEIMKPYIDGLNAILKACQKEKVKRLVLTSTVQTMLGGLTSTDVSKTFTEEDVAEAEKASDLYTKVKIVLEKTAQEFIKELPEEERFELAIINPTLVLGPVTCTATTSCSIDLGKKLLERGIPTVPKMYFYVGDVRDVAQAHIKAMTVPEAAGNRHIVFGQGMWLKEISQVLAKEFKPQGFNVPTMGCPTFAAKMVGLINKDIKAMLPHVGKVNKVENTRMKDVLGVTPREMNDTLIDMGNSMISKGLVKPKPKKVKPEKKKEAEEEMKEGEAKEANGAVSTGEEVAEEGKKEETEKADGEETKEEIKEEEEKKEEEKTEEIKEEEKTEEKKEEEPPAAEETKKKKVPTATLR